MAQHLLILFLAGIVHTGSRTGVGLFVLTVMLRGGLLLARGLMITSLFGIILFLAVFNIAWDRFLNFFELFFMRPGPDDLGSSF